MLMPNNYEVQERLGEGPAEWADEEDLQFNACGNCLSFDAKRWFCWLNGEPEPTIPGDCCNAWKSGA